MHRRGPVSSISAKRTERGNPRLAATVAFATKSPRELPIAKMVSPKMASEMPKMRPRVCTRVYVSFSQDGESALKRVLRTWSTPTTSFTIIRIQTMAIPKPRKERMMRPR